MLIESLGFALNDEDHITWPVERLREWVWEAFAIVATRNPLISSSSVTLPVTKSKVAHPDLFILSVEFAMVDAHGRKIGNLFNGAPRRVTCGAYFASVKNGVVSISPTVDTNQDYHVTANVLDINNPPASIRGVVSQYVLYRAHIIDAETTGVMAQVAESHRSEFHRLLAMIPLIVAVKR